MNVAEIEQEGRLSRLVDAATIKLAVAKQMLARSNMCFVPWLVESEVAGVEKAISEFNEIWSAIKSGPHLGPK